MRLYFLIVTHTLMALSALEQLKAAASMSLQKHEVELPNGEIFAFWSKPLTIGERQKANKEAKSDDVNELALRLLINKARTEDGAPMFAPGQYAELKNAVSEKVLEPVLLALLGAVTEEEEEEVDVSPKDSKTTSRKTAN